MNGSQKIDETTIYDAEKLDLVMPMYNNRTNFKLF